MKIPKEVKQKFKYDFKEKTFELDNVIDFIDEYVVIDIEESIMNFKKKIARNFVAMKENKNRIFVGFKVGNSNKFANPRNIKDINVHDLMIEQLSNKIKGHMKTRRLVKIEKQKTIDGQVSIFEYVGGENYGS